MRDMPLRRRKRWAKRFRVEVARRSAPLRSQTPCTAFARAQRLRQTSAFPRKTATKPRRAPAASRVLQQVAMIEPRKLRCYEYVNRPYEEVRKLLHRRAPDLFQRATTSASARADALAASLRVSVAGVELGVDVRIHVRSIRDEEWTAGLSPITRVSLGWEAARAPALFPSMSAELSAWPLSSAETQLEIEGDYRPPLGAVGKAIDAVALHRIAEASVHRFLEDVVEQLRKELPPST
jgi:hypothetical protein